MKVIGLPSNTGGPLKSDSINFVFSKTFPSYFRQPGRSAEREIRKRNQTENSCGGQSQR